MKEMCKVIEPYICKECGNELLFFVTNNGLIDYKKILSKYKTFGDLYNFLQNKNIKYLKCLVCNKMYIIDWGQHFPQQLIDKDSINKFRV